MAVPNADYHIKLEYIQIGKKIAVAELPIYTQHVCALHLDISSRYKCMLMQVQNTLHCQTLPSGLCHIVIRS